MSVSETPERPLLAVLDYGIGNLHSAHKGFSHVGADTRLTADRGLIRDACGVVLPGVGAFGPCMRALRERGLDEVALDRIHAGIPFFGICIGMQMLFSGSAEAPQMDGLGVFPQLVRPLADTVKRPQIQWNKLDIHREHPMLTDLGDEAWVYFVHSYAPDAGEEVIATCDYGGPVTAAVARDNVWAAQFHPEKSGATGLRILSNFVAFASDSAKVAA
ncbi:MAG: imidazole glycerol phosphate synthase subunit HisH [Acidimicrobiaceae bacterium]|nr:imidazole glycerol phosphate synthase subunit HisH [Acidimicrobiaceae bacterium]MYA73212.1 imidazole glycerol phosphate synthase subunit HisH [Acidimicrobiaceae bacterium]MYD05862.1 imidazole glycerol phosphate synthase subunit HisH [Acidimicrobiaceae bacterium]MYG55567.1 imidazole glycerol phosphate synthase subunit HisH [Acidimicrobiaceae bacterium]MYI58527.1 imidazole glycerol phosphate synthase subunit HisH [Acidimicrobiaceae bacterium]